MKRLAPAKLNLCLRIVRQREDGYHELQTVFQLIDLCDELHFTEREDGQINRLGGLADLAAANDLTVRAAQLLKTHAKTVNAGVDIQLDKRIPAGGGLGGGSSDAATALLALNTLWDCQLNIKQLSAIGLTLGADVPVFIQQQNAYAEGVGETLFQLPNEYSHAAFVVVTPPCHVNTQQIFQHPQLQRDTGYTQPQELFESLLTSPLSQPDNLVSLNDCEALVSQLFPPVANALAVLREHGPAQLTGTGASVFLPCADITTAEAIQRQLPTEWQSWAVKGYPSMASINDLTAGSQTV